MTTATLAGHRATHASLYLSAWGIGYAEVTLDEEVTLSGPVTLAIADLSFVAAILSGGPSKGRSSYRLVGGFGGWGKAIKAKGYANDAGVKLSTVILDAATAAGEILDATTVPTTRLGPSFARGADPASRVLEQLVPQAWYVGEDGITRCGARPVVDLAVQAAVGKLDAARGTVTIAAESIASIVPGIRVSGLVAVDVLHEVTPKRFRATIWGAGIAPTSRRRAAFQRLFEQLDPLRRYRGGPYEYRVVTQEGERLNLQAVRVSLGMPDLQRVVVRPGIAGCRADIALGARVLVSFVNSDPSRPIVVGFEDAEGGGFVPLNLTIDVQHILTLGDGSPPFVARVGDGVSIGQLTVAGGGGATLQFTPAGGTPGPAGSSVTLTAHIAEGSTKVRAQ